MLVYLAGDTTKGAEAVQHDLAEILRAGGSAEVHVVVQHDGPKGAGRFVVGSRPTRTARPTQSLGRLDSSGTDSLIDFLRWGLSVCPAERMALVLRSPMVFSPGDAERDPDRLSVFSLAYDEPSNSYLDVSDMAAAIREALAEAGRDRLDLLAIDGCQVQFLELAYELEDIVHVLLAPQSVVPMTGWHYGRVLSKWKAKARADAPIDTPGLARALLGEIVGSYAREGNRCAVSALDLRRLDDVARAFDNVCIGSLQVLGEGLIWRTRNLLLEGLQQSSGPVYDCGSFFALWKEALEAMADEAHRDWLATTLRSTPGTRLDAFCEAAARYLADALKDIRAGSLLATASARRTSLGLLSGPEDELRDDPTQADSQMTAIQRFRAFTAVRLGEALEATTTAGDERNTRKGVVTRLTGIVTSLRKAQRNKAGKRLVEELERDVASRLARLDQSPNGETSRRAAALMRDALLQVAVLEAFPLLPIERQFDLERMVDSVEGARRIARQSEEAGLALRGDPARKRPGMVIELRSHPASEPHWPRWSGVSMYRPKRLDDLMNDSYTRFAFHRRVHWAALLGASNLIEDHPRALWRLVSSLLASGSASTRRDVLRRLTGPDSVVWGLRDQFQVMTPAPMLTVSLERRTSTPRSDDGVLREHYLLRLEAVNSGAVVTEQESRVQPRVLDRALRELNALLQERSVTQASLGKLRSIGGLLGEDIFQALGRTLEEERLQIVAEQPTMTPHLQLQLPGELMQYPWELLHQHGEWLGERYALGRQVFMQTGLARRVPARRQGRIRPLIIGDPVLEDHMTKKWRQLSGARDEAEQVAAFFEAAALEAGNLIDFQRARDVRIHEALTCADMRALLRDGSYDIVHFAGHGIFEARDPETSAWILSDGELWSLEIRNTLAGHAAPPWLVYANACEAGMDAGGPRPSYQGNVFGLATAFINQGVAAYIGPLWPIDDLMAQHIALDFYRHLLRERLTLGESLRRAKVSARRIGYQERPGTDENASFASLGWASLVLYGDPTEELYQALAGTSASAPAPRPKTDTFTHSNGITRRARSVGSGVGSLPSRAMFPPAIHVPDRVAKKWVSGPGIRLLEPPALADARSEPEPAGTRSARSRSADSPKVLELIEDAGLRRWRVQANNERVPGQTRGAATGGGDGLPGSPFAGLLADERVRWRMPGNRGFARVVGRWALTGFADGTAGLVHAYDKDQVRHEGLLVLQGDDSSALQPFFRNGASTGSADRRALLLVHGTFSKTASPVDGFGPDFIGWARSRYSHVLGFDHWTLSRTPEENARTLLDTLRTAAPHLLTERRLDIIAHSRGGLVARAFSDLLDQRAAVNHMIFLGTPHCGTDLGNPSKWGTLADVLVNMSGVAHADLFGPLAGLLARLAVDGIVEGVPGLLAQNPEELGKGGSFLCRLQQAGARKTRIHYGIVCAEFEPAALVPNLRQLAKSAADAGLDLAADALFNNANDLVVNTSHGWSIGGTPERMLPNLPKWIDPGRVLLFKPPNTELKVPAGITVEAALGVHHINLFSQPRVQTAIRQWLA